MTIDSGDLYLGGGTGLDKFEASTGAFVSQIPLPGFGPPYNGIAFGRSTGETELYSGHGESIAVFGAGLCGSLECPVLQNEWTGADTPDESFVSEKGEANDGDLGSLTDVAVDNSASFTDWAKGDAFATTRTGFFGANPNSNVVDVFEPGAKGKEKYVTQLTGTAPGEPFESPQQVAVSTFNGDVIVVDGRASSTDAVDVFEPAGPGEYVFVSQLAPPNETFANVSLAVDSLTGEIFIAGKSGESLNANHKEPAVYEFGATGEFIGGTSGRETPGGDFNFENLLESVAVDPVSGRLFVGHHGVVDEFGPGVIVPDVTTAPASPVTAFGAMLNGTVNPDEVGAATCKFVYGTSLSFGQTAGCSEAISASEGAGNTPLERHVQIAGLRPDTKYYYRLQATNANGTNLGDNPGEPAQDQEFTTAGPGIHGESASIVTSASATLNALIDPNGAATTYYFQYGTSASYTDSVPLPPGVGIGSASSDIAVNVHLQGLAVATTYHYRVVAVSEPAGELVTVEGPDQTFTTQAAGTTVTLPDGRAWEMVTPPNKQGAAILSIGYEQGDDIQAATNGDGITFGASAPFVANPSGSRSPEVTQVISLRGAPGVWSSQDIATAHTEGATFIAVGHSAEYKLFSDDLSLGFVEPEGSTPLPPLPAGSEKTVYLRVANGEYKALVTSANVPPGTKFGGNGEGAGAVGFAGATPDFSHVFVGSPVPLTATPGDDGGLYELTGGQLSYAGPLGLAGVRGAVAGDGSRVVVGGTGAIYLRDLANRETAHVGGGKYVTANSEDSRVFSTEGGALNVFEVTSGKGEPLAGETTKLTETGEVDGVIGASEDGSFVYFVDSGVLGDGAEHGAETGGNNLYVEHYDEGTKAWSAPAFIAALSGEDSPSWSSNGDLDQMTSRVSPNGRYLTFMSENSLTGYENRDVNSGVPDEEVFIYDASTGRLACASCNPTGARPAGIFVGGQLDEHLVDYTRGLWENRWVAGNIPGWTSKSLIEAIYQSRYLSNSGRLFFDSNDALVPADVNGTEDVYEYEPAGVGSCQPPGYGQNASDVFVENIGGCVALISAGTSAEESAFMDASENGSDVFFMTLSKLSPQDVDTSLDVYDAHECSASVPCAPAAAAVPAPCSTGDSCKPAPAVQPSIFGDPSSATFSGAGNVVPSGSKPAVASRSATRARKLANALKRARRRLSASVPLARDKLGNGTPRRPVWRLGDLVGSPRRGGSKNVPAIHSSRTGGGRHVFCCVAGGAGGCGARVC